jgi:hypothetical protein
MGAVNVDAAMVAKVVHRKDEMIEFSNGEARGGEPA